VMKMQLSKVFHFAGESSSNIEHSTFFSIQLN
jgi:hypothetical protein